MSRIFAALLPVLLVSALLVAAAPASGGILYAGVPGSSGELLIFLIDPATGGLPGAYPTGTSTYTSPTSTIDPATGRLFFLSGSELYIVSLPSGQRSHLTTDPGLTYGFDGATDTLFTLKILGGQVQVCAVDLTTGAATPALPTGATSLVADSATFDPVGRRFFFFSGAELFIAELGSGAVTHVPSQGARYEYDPVREKLYGLANSMGQVELFEIDLQTGASSPVIATGATAMVSGISAIDPFAGEIYFQAPDAIYTLHLDDGAVSQLGSGEVRFLESNAAGPIAVEVPAAIGPGLLLLAAALAAAGLWRIGRAY